MLSTLVHKCGTVFSRMLETLHPASGIQSDSGCHSFAALEDKSEPCGSEPVLERSEGKNLRPLELVAVFMK